MNNNKKIISHGYKKLLKFDTLFSIINGILFVSSATSGENGYGLMMLGIFLLFIDVLIAVGHGFISYTKFHSFLRPHFYFVVIWNILVTTIVLLPTKNIDYCAVVLRLCSIFLLFSCIGALIAKIVMIIKKTNISKVSEIISKVEETTSSDTDSD